MIITFMHNFDWGKNRTLQTISTLTSTFTMKKWEKQTQPINSAVNQSLFSNTLEHQPQRVWVSLSQSQLQTLKDHSL